MDKQGETLDYNEIIDLVRFIRGELQDRIAHPLIHFHSAGPVLYQRNLA